MQTIDLKVIGRMAIVLVLIVAASATNAESVDERYYGKCSVESIMDDFEDKLLFHLLTCASDPEQANRSLLSQSFDAVAVACNKDINSNFIGLKPAEFLFTINEFVDIRYRFDKHDSIRGTWNWSSQFARKEPSSSEMNHFLDHMEHAKRLIFEVDNARNKVRGRVVFGKETIDAISDFKDRCLLNE